MSKNRCFVFTLNNYTDESLIVLDELDCKYLIYGKEVAPSTGTPHLQGYVSFPSPRSLSSVRKKIVGAHVSVAKGTGVQNRDYCIKEGDFTEPWHYALNSSGWACCACCSQFNSP